MQQRSFAMILKSLLQLIDVPFAIVAGSVCAVLAIQFGATTLMAQDAAPRHGAQVTAQASADCALVARCRSGKSPSLHQDCEHQSHSG